MKVTVKKLRKALGLSQEAFAKAIGKSYASVRNYEDGRKVPAAVMAKMLGLAAKAGVSGLADEVEKWAAELYDTPIEAVVSEEGAAREESAADRERLHALVDYVLDFGPQGFAQALRQTIGVYFRAVGTVSDAGGTTASSLTGAPLGVRSIPETEMTGVRAKYRVIFPILKIGGRSLKCGEILELDVETAKVFGLALLPLDEGEEGVEKKRA